MNLAANVNVSHFKKKQGTETFGSLEIATVRHGRKDA